MSPKELFLELASGNVIIIAHVRILSTSSKTIPHAQNKQYARELYALINNCIFTLRSHD